MRNRQQHQPVWLHGVTPSGDTEVVVFEWSTHLGRCYECGLPAAFWLPSVFVYRRNPSTRDEHGVADVEKRCAICAANAAAEGEHVARIEPEEQ